MESLSILHTAEFYAPHVGGSEEVRRISEGLARRGHRVTVATSALCGRSIRELGGVEVEGFEIAGRAGDGIIGKSDRYERFLLDGDWDVVMNYAAQQWATDLALELVGHTWSRRVNVIAPCGYSALREDLSLRLPRFRHYFRTALPAALPLYDAVVYHSPALRDYAFGRRLGLANGEIIHNGADEREFRAAPAPYFRKKYGISTPAMGLCVANYLPDKGYDRIIEAVRRMERPDFTMVCIGCSTDLLQALIRKAAGAPIRFLADVPRADTVAAFFEADVFLFASRIEASPLVVLEAKAAGLPFVSTDVGDVREYAGGVVVPPDALPRVTSALLDDPARRRALGAAGRAEWQDAFTWDRIVDRWEALYGRLHAAKRELGHKLRIGAARPPPPPQPRKRIAGVVFSKDRPLQLDATLRSCAIHARETDAFQMAVLYTASSSRLEALYRQVRREHPDVWFLRERDFRSDLLAFLRGHEAVLFLVDDCVFVRPVPMETLSRRLAADPEAIGLSLRLGQNTTYCYSMDRPQRVPPVAHVGDGLMRFSWPGADLDFGYPLEVSSSLYRLNLMLPLLESLDFDNPNALEAALLARTARYRETKPALLSSAVSMAFCLPLNRVHDAGDNRAGTSHARTAAELAEAYRAGARVDVGALSGHVPGACHEELELPLVVTAERCPVVSVVIPCFGQAQFLEACIGSVLSQTFDDWEIVIVDDGSPDDTAGTARRLAGKYADRAIRLVRQPNGGLASARNAGVAASRGAYILPLDADDVLEPRMLEACCELLDREPGVAIAGTDVRHFGEEQRIVQMPSVSPARLREGNRLNYCSMYRRAVWEDTGGYNELMSLGYEDWDYWVRCAERGLLMRRIPEPLLRYRVKPHTMLGTARAHEEQLHARVVLDNPRSYTAARRRAAAAVLIADPLPPPPRAPMVSVVVPTRNRPHLLREALASILGQSFQDLEIIVVNDAGIDVEDAVRLSGAAPVTHIVRHQRRLGLAAARNTALGFARGRYIAYLDDDDHFLPHHLDVLLTLLRTSGLRVAYADALRFQEVPLASSPGRYARSTELVPHSCDWSADGILRGNFIPVPCIVHERSCLLESGLFDESLTSQEDWDLWIRMSRKFHFAHVPLVTTEFRWRTDGSTMSSTPDRRYLRTFLRIVARSMAWRAFPPDLARDPARPLAPPLRDAVLEGVPGSIRAAAKRIRRRALSPLRVK